MVSVFTRFRSQAEAQAMIGKTVKIRGVDYIVHSFNDLGCLYGHKIGRKTLYVLD